MTTVIYNNILREDISSDPSRGSRKYILNGKGMKETMAISNTARPSMRGLRAAFGNATNGVRDQWDDFKDQHKSVRFLSEQAGKLGRTIQTKAKHFGTDFVAAYHAFRSSYEDRHKSSYLEQCRDDLEAAGFSVDAGSDGARSFMDAWREQREAREAREAEKAARASARAARSNVSEGPAADEALTEGNREEPESLGVPEGAAPSDVAATAKAYSKDGINGALLYLVDILKEYEAAPEDQRSNTLLGKALQAAKENVESAPANEDLAPKEGEKAAENDAPRTPSGPEPTGRDAAADAAKLTAGLESGGEGKDMEVPTA